MFGNNVGKISSYPKVHKQNPFLLHSLQVQIWLRVHKPPVSFPYMFTAGFTPAYTVIN